jgi:hypothetical protein
MNFGRVEIGRFAGDRHEVDTVRFVGIPRFVCTDMDNRISPNFIVCLGFGGYEARAVRDRLLRDVWLSSTSRGHISFISYRASVNDMLRAIRPKFHVQSLVL